MIPASSYLEDNTVTLTLTAWTTDADGGRIPAGTTVRTDIPAAVLPGRPIRLTDTAPDTGLLRITVLWPVTVCFGEDVGLNVDDLVAWEDESGTVHTYQVKGYGPVAGRPGDWVATCEERR